MGEGDGSAGEHELGINARLARHRQGGEKAGDGGSDVCSNCEWEYLLQSEHASSSEGYNQ